MVPQLVNYPELQDMLLPKGIYQTTLEEVKMVFVFNLRRKYLFDGLVDGVTAFSKAGCSRLFLDGSFVTSKEISGDYDTAWDPEGVNINILDPVFYTEFNRKSDQKDKYRGEYLLTTNITTKRSTHMLNLFQTVRESPDKQKGILRIDLIKDPCTRGARYDP